MVLGLLSYRLRVSGDTKSWLLWLKVVINKIINTIYIIITEKYEYVYKMVDLAYLFCKLLAYLNVISSNKHIDLFNMLIRLT